MHPKALLDACADLLRQVLPFRQPMDMVVSRYLREHRDLGSRARATVAETAYAVVRHKLLFEHLAPSGVGPQERRLAILGFVGDRDFLQSALSDTEKQWLRACDAVDRAAVLQRHVHNLPQWLADALQAELGDDYMPLVHSLLQPAPLDVRVNTWVAKREAVLQGLQAAGLSAELTPWSPWGIRLVGKPPIQQLALFQEGALEVQDEGSQLLALLLDAKRGEMVVDFCAGAGGKTLALGAAMRSTGRLYAFDTSAHRLEALKPRLARSGLSNVHPVAIAHERDERVKRLRGKIDRVLVDAPCSGLGTLRRNPDLKWRQNPQAVAEMALKQTAILAAAATLLKPGGRLVYATCSPLREENEAVVQAFDAAHPGFQSLSAAELLLQLKVNSAAQLCSPDGRFLRLWPHRHRTDGFFAAIWSKS